MESVGPSSLSRCMSAVQVPVSLFMDRLVGVSGPRSPPMPGDIAVSWHSARSRLTQTAPVLGDSGSGAISAWQLACLS